MVALKQANPDPGELRAVAETLLALYAGNDDMLLEVVELGGAGVISVSSHLVGEEMGAVAEDVRRGDLDEARGATPGSPTSTPACSSRRAPSSSRRPSMTGLIPLGRLRLPLVEARRAVQRDILHAVLERRGILSRA